MLTIMVPQPTAEDIRNGSCKKEWDCNVTSRLTVIYDTGCRETRQNHTIIHPAVHRAQTRNDNGA